MDSLYLFIIHYYPVFIYFYPCRCSATPICMWVKQMGKQNLKKSNFTYPWIQCPSDLLVQHMGRKECNRERQGEGGGERWRHNKLLKTICGCSVSMHIWITVCCLAVVCVSNYIGSLPLCHTTSEGWGRRSSLRADTPVQRTRNTQQTTHDTQHTIHAEHTTHTQHTTHSTHNTLNTQPTLQTQRTHWTHNTDWRHHTQHPTDWTHNILHTTHTEHTTHRIHNTQNTQHTTHYTHRTAAKEIQHSNIVKTEVWVSSSLYHSITIVYASRLNSWNRLVVFICAVFVSSCHVCVHNCLTAPFIPATPYDTAAPLWHRCRADRRDKWWIR